MTATFFATSRQFRAWLETYAATSTALVVGFWKVDSGRPSMTWSESVDEALCFGWIDSVRKRIDVHAYQVRFTPRRSTSIFSAVNVRKFHELSNRVRDGRRRRGAGASLAAPRGGRAVDGKKASRACRLYEGLQLRALERGRLARPRRRLPAETVRRRSLLSMVRRRLDSSADSSPRMSA